MLEKFRGQLNYANVTATVALVFAMGGTAIAASDYLKTGSKAGGALAGRYPKPSLAVKGGSAGHGKCRNGQSLAGLGANASVLCRIGVYTDAKGNLDIGARPGNTEGIPDVNVLRIGSAQTRARIPAFDSAIGGPFFSLAVNEAGEVGYGAISSRWKKRDISSVASLIPRVLALHPVSYRYKRRYGSQKLQFGLIAEQVQKVLPELVAHPRGQRGLAVFYSELPPLLLAVVQRQQGEIRSLRRLVEQQSRASHRR